MKTKNRKLDLQVLEDTAFQAYENFRALSNELFIQDELAWHNLQRRIYGSDQT